jgi:hypothetical protein
VAQIKKICHIPKGPIQKDFKMQEMAKNMKYKQEI